MLNQGQFMSLRGVHPRGVVLQTSPRAGGIQLGTPAQLGVPDLLIHECGFLTELEDWNSRNVMSSFWRLWYNLEGGSCVTWDGGQLDLTPQRIVLMPTSVVFDTDSSRAVPRLWMHFSLLPNYAFIGEPFALEIDVELQWLLSNLLECHQSTEVDGAKMYHRTAALLHGCLARYSLTSRALPDRLRDLLHQIEVSPGDDFSTARMARQIGLSTSAFTRSFKAHLGEPPSAYVRRARLEQAERLLCFSEASVEQIAAELGFPNRDYFSRVFVDYAGCGPSTFRKRHLAKSRR